jgi:hypothetical protein
LGNNLAASRWMDSRCTCCSGEYKGGGGSTVGGSLDGSGFMVQRSETSQKEGSSVIVM